MLDREHVTWEDAANTVIHERHYEWIGEHFGFDVAANANIGYGDEAAYVETKVYGYGVLSTRATRAEQGFDLWHSFEPFEAPAA